MQGNSCQSTSGNFKTLGKMIIITSTTTTEAAATEIFPEALPLVQNNSQLLGENFTMDSAALNVTDFYEAFLSHQSHVEGIFSL